MNRAITAIAAAALLVQTLAVCAQEKSLTFKNRSMGEIDDTQATKAGFRSPAFGYAHFGFTNFKASNGEALMMLYGEFRNPEEAKHYFDWKVGRASKVLSQAMKTNHKDMTSEYRAELVPESDHSGVEVMWVVGVAVHVIRARKLADALELESQYGH